METKLKDIEGHIQELINGRKKIIDLYARGTIDRSTYVQRCQKHDGAIKKAKAERTGIIKSIPALYKRGIVDVSIQQFC